MNTSNQDGQIDVVDIEKKFSAAKRLAEHMGIIDGWAVLKANEIVMDSTGVDCLDVFGIPKWTHETLTKESDGNIRFFIHTCFDGSNNNIHDDWISFEILYSLFERYCIDMNRKYMHRELFIKSLSLHYNTDNLEKIPGISFKKCVMPGRDQS